MHINSMLIDEMSQLLHAHYRVTKTKNPNMDQPRSKNDAKDLDTKPDKSSTLPVIGAHTADGDSTDTTKKTDSKDFTQGGARGAHILDGEDLPNEITKRAQVSADAEIKMMLAAYPSSDPYWGGKNRDDEVCVDTVNSEENGNLFFGMHTLVFNNEVSKDKFFLIQFPNMDRIMSLMMISYLR